MSTIVDIAQLQISFKTAKGFQPVVKGLNLSLQRGKTLGIVGESGSGKSVSSLAIMGLLPGKRQCRMEGSIRFSSQEGQEPVELNGLSEASYRAIRGNQISMIFQEPMTALNPVYTCGAQVMEAVQLHLGLTKVEAKEKVLALFAEVLLPDPARIFKSYPHQVSGGQRQRVMIAMALAGDPALLIADEPTTALDVTTQAAIVELIGKLQRDRGMSIIFISHDLSLVAGISDQLAVMYKGDLVEEGPAQQIFEQPQHPYTKGLLACRPGTADKSFRLPVMSDFIAVDESGVVQALPTKPLEKVTSPVQEQEAPVALAVDQLSKVYTTVEGLLRPKVKKTYSVNQVHLEVYKGECLGLVGESGCGKSTLSRLMLRLIEPTEGQVTFQDIDITSLNSRQMKPWRRKLQIIFQDPYSSLNPRQTIREILTEPMVVHLSLNAKERELRAEELLEKVGLGKPYIDRYPHELSGGQRQRVCIARCLALEPEFIICDESVSALDVSVQAQVLNLLRDLQRELGLTYVFITHDLNVVRFMADRIAVMKQGEIVELQESESLFKQPETDYTKKLLSALPS